MDEPAKEPAKLATKPTRKARRTYRRGRRPSYMARRLIQRVAVLRGIFLDLTWRIERRVALLIANTLCVENRANEALLAIILGHREVTFHVKCEILEQLHEVMPVLGLEGTFKLTKKVRDFRNKLAHSVFNHQDTGALELIRLAKGRVIREPLDPDEMLRMTETARNLLDLLNEVIEYQRLGRVPKA